MNKRVIISVTNDLSNDQRVHRGAQTLHDNGFEVLLIGREKSNSKPLEPRDYRTVRLKLAFEKGKLFYLAFNLRLFFFLLFKKADHLLANDLDTLLANFLIHKIKGTDLIYDSHEYFTEVPELVHRPGTRKVWLFLEKMIFPRLKKAFSVNKSIAGAYENRYGIKVGVVRNLPFRKDLPILAIEDRQPKCLLYQGALNIGRGIDLMIESLRFLPGYSLTIAGRGDIEDELKARTKELGLEGRVHFTGHLTFEELSKTTSTAVLGFSLEEDLGENYRLALPNKLFDYIQAGVPAIISDLPEMRRIVEEYGTGIIFQKEDRTPEKLAEKVREVVENDLEWKRLVGNCEKASRELCWKNEKEWFLTYFK